MVSQHGAEWSQVQRSANLQFSNTQREQSALHSYTYIYSTHMLTFFILSYKCRLFRTSKVIRGELKIHDVFSALRYRHDICPVALLSCRQASIWRQTYQLITLPS